jgi:hypothetical protein
MPPAQVRSALTARYTLIETRKDGTKFTSKKLRDAAERLAAAGGRYEALQKELVEQVVAVAATFVEARCFPRARARAPPAAAGSMPLRLIAVAAFRPLLAC